MGAALDTDRDRVRGLRASAHRLARLLRPPVSVSSRLPWQPVPYLAAFLLLGGLVFVYHLSSPYWAGPFPDTSVDGGVTSSVVPPFYSLQPLALSALPNRAAVEKAVRFLLSLQPERSYILTTARDDDVVHMDVAHAAIALSKVGHMEEARGAMDWLLSHMTLPDSPDRFGQAVVDGVRQPIDYAGSWYDHFRANGEPRRDLTRGRGEGVGIALIATYAITQEDPTYPLRMIDGITVADRVGMAARYLSSRPVQRDDGRFNHRPDYAVSFVEEGARMALGLQLAGRILTASGRPQGAADAASHGSRGLAALHKGDGIDRGMAFDFYALSIWGMASADRAREEFDSLRQARLLSPDGVSNWDWQLGTAQSLGSRLGWWAAAQSIGPAQTFDWAIANVTVGNVEEARRIERRWLPLQRPDGGFAGAYLPGLIAGVGDPTSYTAARFVLLQRLLVEAGLLSR